jgi:hypothetical protein
MGLTTPQHKKKLVTKILKKIDLAQDRDQWRTLVNMVMNFQAP